MRGEGPRGEPLDGADLSRLSRPPGFEEPEPDLIVPDLGVDEGKYIDVLNLGGRRAGNPRAIQQSEINSKGSYSRTYLDLKWVLGGVRWRFSLGRKEEEKWEICVYIPPRGFRKHPPDRASAPFRAFPQRDLVQRR